MLACHSALLLVWHTDSLDQVYEGGGDLVLLGPDGSVCGARDRHQEPSSATHNKGRTHWFALLSGVKREPTSTFPVLGFQALICLAFLLWTWGSNSGPYSWAASTLPIDLPPQWVTSDPHSIYI